MQTVCSGNFEKCVEYIKKEEVKDETLCFDLVQSNISEDIYYVKELDGLDTYKGSY